MKSPAEITEEGVQIFAFELVRFLSNFKAFSGPCYPHFGSFLRVWSGIGRKLEQGGGRRCVLASFWSQLCCQNVPRGSQDASKLAILAPKCDQDGQLGGPNEALRGSRVAFLDRGRDLMKKSTNSKNERQYSVLEGFGHAGGSARTLLEPLFAHLDAILGYDVPSWQNSLTTKRQNATLLEPR